MDPRGAREGQEIAEEAGARRSAHAQIAESQRASLESGFRIPVAKSSRRRGGRPCPRLLFDAVENQPLRRWTHGPPAPGVIRATATNRVDTQPHRTIITMKPVPALAAPPVMAWTPPGLYRGMIAVNRGSHHATRRRPR